MNLQETVLMQLRDLILRGTFEPGQRLAEQQLAERLGASRTPVRSALVTLEQEGLIEASDTGKYLVRQFTPREVADAIAVRGHLEGMAARLVAEAGGVRATARIAVTDGGVVDAAGGVHSDHLLYQPVLAGRVRFRNRPRANWRVPDAQYPLVCDGCPAGGCRGFLGVQPPAAAGNAAAGSSPPARGRPPPAAASPITTP